MKNFVLETRSGIVYPKSLPVKIKNNAFKNNAFLPVDVCFLRLSFKLNKFFCNWSFKKHNAAYADTYF